MTKTVTGTWQFPDGSAVANGTLYLQLTQDANVVSTGQIAPRIVQITLDATGSIPAATVVFANDELTPSGTLYQVAVTQQGGGRVYGPELYSITGTSPISLNSFVPLTSGVFVSVGPKFQQFTANGTFTIPNGITQVKVTVLGAGGGGGGGTNAANTSGAGGGSGSLAYKWLSGLTPGNTLAVTIGTGGTGVAGATGNVGTGSTVASGTQVITSIVTNGGGGGAGAGVQNPGLGGTAGTGGDINLAGVPGFAFPQGTTSLGGAGGPSIYGGNGAEAGGTSTGLSATGFGSGGGGAGGAGGAGNTTGGAGANGFVMFEWVG